MIVQQKAILRLFSAAAAFLSALRFAGLHHATPGLHVRSGSGSEKDTEHWNGVSSMLVCGDGDLSYSACCLSTQLAKAGVTLTATVLEDKDTHHNGVLSPWLFLLNESNCSHFFLLLILDSNTDSVHEFATTPGTNTFFWSRGSLWNRCNSASCLLSKCNF
jgi:hypothetical protein